MTTTHTRTKFAVAVGAAIAGATAPALLFLGAGTTQALADVSERGGIAIIDHLPTPRTCGQCGESDSQPDPAGNPDPGGRVGIGNPNDLPPLTVSPGSKVGIGNPNESLVPSIKAGP